MMKIYCVENLLTILSIRVVALHFINKLAFAINFWFYFRQHERTSELGENPRKFKRNETGDCALYIHKLLNGRGRIYGQPLRSPITDIFLFFSIVY